MRIVDVASARLILSDAKCSVIKALNRRYSSNPAHEPSGSKAKEHPCRSDCRVPRARRAGTVDTARSMQTCCACNCSQAMRMFCSVLCIRALSLLQPCYNHLREARSEGDLMAVGTGLDLFPAVCACNCSKHDLCSRYYLLVRSDCSALEM